MKVLVLVEVPESDDYTEQDVKDGLLARLDEFYPNDIAIPDSVRVSTRGVDSFFMAAAVGCEAPDLDEEDDHLSRAFAVYADLMGEPPYRA